MSYLMIVDDDEDFAFATAKVLRAEGHEVKIELDPASGMESMLQRCPDLVILDVMFPEDSAAGFLFSREIRQAHAPLRTVPILLLTAVNAKFSLGFGNQDIHQEWLPVEAFLEKPVDLAVLLQKVAAMLVAASPEPS